ncbi:MAG: general secretion pathway protein GspK, partial [Betaproteobacteria bacterium]|nr:general secretion pathway protein GspK [Betaproteobacteria bacterium]
LDPNLADAAADWIDADDETLLPGGQENALYFAAARPARAANRLLVHPAELARARGFDEATLQRLSAFVTALPVRTKVNVNTAPEEVIAAIAPELDADMRTVLIRERQLKPFASISGAEGFATRFKALKPATAEGLDVGSDFLLLQLALEVPGAQGVRSALLRRRATGGVEDWPAIIWTQNAL